MHEVKKRKFRDVFARYQMIIFNAMKSQRRRFGRKKILVGITILKLAEI